MTEIINVLKERAGGSEGEKNEIYYTEKQKRVLKTIAENPHASASEVADESEVHPSYIPYICERVDQEVVDNLHRLEEYLSDQEEVEASSETSTESEGVDQIMESFGAKPTVDDHERPPEESTTELTFTKEVPVQISVEFPDGAELTKMIEEEQKEDDEDEDRRVLTAD